jgi:hypothetical protein
MFGTHKYLWGNMPALKIMNIDQNEGTAYNKDVDAHVTERWQALCQDCGVNPVPPSIKKCKKVQSLSAMRLTGFL